MSTVLIRFREKNSRKEFRPGLATGDAVADISGRYPTIAAFLEENEGGWNPELQAPGDTPTFRRDDVSLGPPIDPGRMIYAVGANYRQHAGEAGLGVPKTPVIFFKPYPSLVGPGEPISIPSVSSKLDYEGEMAVVIGKDATKVSRGNARRHVAAVTSSTTLPHAIFSGLISARTASSIGSRQRRSIAHRRSGRASLARKPFQMSTK
jgi:2-keto-4-pentenoate hydratase/2-oxohepta-3-ene-1,7-dioic acid hydratase in catechol pathway